MKVLLTGATGMVGQAALMACLADERVTAVTTLGRTTTGRAHAKLTEVVADLADLRPVHDRIRGHDAVLWCMGVSAVGMDPEAYRKVTYDYALDAARLLADDQLVFAYVSGAGTKEHGRQRWAQVKGKTESDLLALLPRAVMFRPGFIQPRDGIRSRTGWYQAMYNVVGVLSPLIPKRYATDTRILGRAFVEAALGNAPKRILESKDINELGKA